MGTTRHITIRLCYIFTAGLLLCLPGGIVKGQNVDAHKNKVSQIEKEIQYLDKQISSTQQKHKNTLQELVFIEKKVLNRKKLLEELDSRLKEQNRTIEAKNESIRLLEERLDTLEFYYKHLVLNTYKNRDSRIWFMYILASDNIEQGYRRWKYLKNYSNNINRQGEKVKEIKQEVTEQKAVLLKLRNETIKAQQQREEEYRNLQKEELRFRTYAKALANNQSKYRRQLEQKKKEAERLNKEIERMLADAMKTKPAQKGEKSKTENIKLSADFQSNKGKLPWPVKSGVVIEQFGQHNHPLFKGVKMPFNNGINISTDVNSEVFAVFNGIVKQIIVIPGYNQCVLVQHGSYFTFYCKLSKVSVKVGETVKTGTVLGYLSNTENTSTLHFELWNGTVKQNPQLWLRKQ